MLIIGASAIGFPCIFFNKSFCCYISSHIFTYMHKEFHNFYNSKLNYQIFKNKLGFSTRIKDCIFN